MKVVLIDRNLLVQPYPTEPIQSIQNRNKYLSLNLKTNRPVFRQFQYQIHNFQIQLERKPQEIGLY